MQEHHGNAHQLYIDVQWDSVVVLRLAVSAAGCGNKDYIAMRRSVKRSLSLGRADSFVQGLWQSQQFCDNA